MDLHAIDTEYTVILRPTPREVDQRPHLVTFRVIGHQVAEVWPGKPRVLIEVVEAVAKVALVDRD